MIDYKRVKKDMLSRFIIDDIDEIRNQLGISAEKLGKLTDFSRQHVHSVLRSNTCSLQTACILADALGYELKLVKKEGGDEAKLENDVYW